MSSSKVEPSIPLGKDTKLPIGLRLIKDITDIDGNVNCENLIVPTDMKIDKLMSIVELCAGFKVIQLGNDLFEKKSFRLCDLPFFATLSVKYGSKIEGPCERIEQQFTVFVSSQSSTSSSTDTLNPLDFIDDPNTNSSASSTLERSTRNYDKECVICFSHKRYSMYKTPNCKQLICFNCASRWFDRSATIPGSQFSSLDQDQWKSFVEMSGNQCPYCRKLISPQDLKRVNHYSITNLDLQFVEETNLENAENTDSTTGVVLTGTVVAVFEPPCLLEDNSIVSPSNLIFSQGRGVMGLASYHFGNSPLEAYISYARAPPTWRLKDFTSPPAKKNFEETQYDPATNTFKGIINWGINTFGGSAKWEYEIVFDKYFRGIISGSVKSFRWKDENHEELEQDHISIFGKELLYLRHDRWPSPSENSEESSS